MLSFPLLLFSAVATSLSQEIDNLAKYTCQFGGAFKVEESAERSEPFLRPVVTANGEKTVEIAHGFSLHIAYEGTPFVNFKAERLAGDNYARDKRTLVESLTYSTANTAGMESSEPQRSMSDGFEVYGINRKELAGGVLSVYLLIRDDDRTVVTLYILNTPPEKPEFHTVAEYHKLRDDFLNVYTRCVSKNLQP